MLLDIHTENKEHSIGIQYSSNLRERGNMIMIYFIGNNHSKIYAKAVTILLCELIPNLLNLNTSCF